MIKKEKDKTVKLLYVEDDEDIRVNIERLLRRRFEHVIVKENGLEGLNSFKEDNPDIIISDILMPKMTGHQMAEEIRKINEDIPIIFTTAHSDSDHLLKAIELGITHYVIKPIDREKLFQALEKSRKVVVLEKELEDSRAMFSSLSENSVAGVFVFKNNFRYTNTQFEEITGFSSEELGEKNLSDLFSQDSKDSQEKIKLLSKYLEEQKAIDENHFEGKIITKEGKEKWLYFAVNFIHYKGEYIAIGNAVDITKIKELQSELEEKALLDNLTKAYNRNGFNDIFIKELKRADRYNEPLSIIMLDIDHFKKINDTYGHLRGDEVLKSLSAVIKQHMRSSDYFVRWGGEEFIVLATETLLEGAKTLAENLRAKVEEFNFEEVGTITISLGVAQKQIDESEADFLNRVDEALYKAKNGGRNQVVYN